MVGLLGKFHHRWCNIPEENPLKNLTASGRNPLIWPEKRGVSQLPEILRKGFLR